MTDLKTFEIDTETVTTTRPFGDPGDEPETLKGRCTTCWAGIVMRSNPDHKCVEITCRGCGKSMVGQAAEQEHDRMWQEQGDHSIRLSGEIELAYDRKAPGSFVWKIAPSLKRETESAFKARIRKSSQTKAPSGYFGRGRFPLGSPGLLFLQAKILSDGLDSVPGFHEGAIGGFPHTEHNDDGSLSVYYTKEEFEGGPSYREHRMMKMMGANMVASMSSAFACELAIKAMCLTCNCLSLKSHDLYDLYSELPDESRARVEFDYPELPDVLHEGRERFGDWRYFESVIGEPALLALTTPVLSRSLLKSARVLLDEGAALGLSGSVDMEARQGVRVIDENRIENYSYQLKVHGGESPSPIPK